MDSIHSLNHNFLLTFHFLVSYNIDFVNHSIFLPRIQHLQQNYLFLRVSSGFFVPETVIPYNWISRRGTKIWNFVCEKNAVGRLLHKVSIFLGWAACLSFLLIPQFHTKIRPLSLNWMQNVNNKKNWEAQPFWVLERRQKNHKMATKDVKWRRIIYSSTKGRKGTQRFVCIIYTQVILNSSHGIACLLEWKDHSCTSRVKIKGCISDDSLHLLMSSVSIYHSFFSRVDDNKREWFTASHTEIWQQSHPPRNDRMFTWYSLVVKIATGWSLVCV